MNTIKINIEVLNGTSAELVIKSYDEDGDMLTADVIDIDINQSLNVKELIEDYCL